MSMNGDLPGLSNFCPGTIGSCQYRTFLPGADSFSPVLEMPAAIGATGTALDVAAFLCVA